MTSILITIVLTALLVTNAVASPAELPHYNYLQKRADPVIASVSGYDKRDRLQIKDAIVDARRLMIYAIKDLQHDGTGIFAKYFKDDEKSRTKVRRVFEALLGGEPHQGNLNNSPSLPPFGSSALANITIRPNYFLKGSGYSCRHPNEVAALRECEVDTSPNPDWNTKPVAILVPLPGTPPTTGHIKGRPQVPEKPNHLRKLPFDGLHPKLVVCGAGFEFGGINKGYKGGAYAVTCRRLGGRVSYSMETLGSIFLHEYLHFESLLVPELLPARVGDIAFGPHACRQLRDPAPFFNADSYSWYATEVYWTMTCGENFREPSGQDDRDPRCDCDVCHA